MILLTIFKGICVFLFIGFAFSVFMSKNQFWMPNSSLIAKVFYSLAWPITLIVILKYIIKNRKETREQVNSQ